MKYLLGLVVFVGALSLVGNIDYSDELAYQQYRCEMVMLHEQSKYSVNKYSVNKYDVNGYPARDEKELEFCTDLINAQQ